MSVQPTNKPEWATTDVTLPTAQTPNKIRPSEVLRTIGYDKDQVPTAQELNWQLNNIHLWIEHLLGRIEGVSSQPLLSLQDVYPIGSVYVNASNNANPATIFGFGTWQAMGQGRVLVGAGTGTDSRGEAKEFPIAATGGEYKHVLTEQESPPHKHECGVSNLLWYRPYGISSSGGYNPVGYDGGWTTGHPYTSTIGGGQAHNNIQPYLVVYMWKRTA